jgi:putative MATE family efflux protein
MTLTTGAKDFTQGAVFNPLIKLAMPIMATGFVQMAYHLTDMAWVGRLGSEAVAAIGAVGMLSWLVSAFPTLTKVASEVSIGHAIGARKNNEAAALASHTVTISLIMSLCIAFVLFTFADYIITFFKLKPDIQIIAVEYLRIISFSIPFSFIILNFIGIYTGIGRSNAPFIFVVFGLIFNIILDPILIFGIKNVFAGMGVQGAAIATLVSQGLVFMLLIYKIRKHDGILKRFAFVVRPRINLTTRILRLGIPAAVLTLFHASINTVLVRIASEYGGHIGLMAKTAGGQIEAITWNTSQGFSTALGAFVAQNFAAKKMKRAWKAYRYTLTTLISLGIFVSIAFLFFGKEIFGIIVPEIEAAKVGGEYLYIMAFSQIFMMIELTTQGMFNGLGRTVPPAIVSIIFNILRIPMGLFLIASMGISGLWWAISITSIIKGILLPLWLLKYR